MTTRSAHPTMSTTLRRLIWSAHRAPSVHNTQPWTFVTEPGQVSIRADRGRQLRVLDPTGRQLLISCGCALFNLRVTAAADSLATRVWRQPDPGDPDLVATVLLADDAAIETELVPLDAMVASRRTNRRRFSAEPVPATMIRRLVSAAEAEGAQLVEVTTEPDRAFLAELSQLADAAQLRDPAYRAEVREWTTDDPYRRDGVPAIAVPHVGGDSGDELPMRDFDSRGSGFLPARTASTRDKCLVLLGTESDDPMSWLRAGEALERILLEIAAHGFETSPLTQVIEVRAAREELRSRLGLTMYPQLLLRIGRAAPTPGTPRRPLADVLIEHRDEAR